MTGEQKMNNKKRKIPHCDYHGTCGNKAYKEVYPSMLGGKYKNSGWSHLCRKHFLQEQRRFKNRLPHASVG